MGCKLIQETVCILRKLRHLQNIWNLRQLLQPATLHCYSETDEAILTENTSQTSHLRGIPPARQKLFYFYRARFESVLHSLSRCPDTICLYCSTLKVTKEESWHAILCVGMDKVPVQRSDSCQLCQFFRCRCCSILTSLHHARQKSLHQSTDLPSFTTMFRPTKWSCIWLDGSLICILDLKREASKSSPHPCRDSR